MSQTQHDVKGHVDHKQQHGQLVKNNVACCVKTTTTVNAIEYKSP